MQTEPRVAVAPGEPPRSLAVAVATGGGRLVAPMEAEALVWLEGDVSDLAGILADLPAVRWVQLSSAGVDGYVGLMRDGRVWTSARGIHSEPVAEHALLLALGCLRSLGVVVRARRWRPAPPRSLFDTRVVIIGGGSVATHLVRLLVPFRTRVVIVRRRPGALPGATATVGPDALEAALEGADVVFLAAALTADTAGLIAAPQLRVMRHDACLVNVARGRLVITDDLVRALEEGWIGAAGLDVTDPEPLPRDHPLWRLDNCLLTGHCAGTLQASFDRFCELVAANVERWSRAQPLLNVVDAARGY